MKQSRVLIKQGGIQLLLTEVDTPASRGALANSNCWQPIIDYTDSKSEDCLNAELNEQMSDA